MRAYRFLAVFVIVALVAAFVVGTLGATGPGVLSPESAFLVAGLAILVLALALVYVLITYRSAFTRLQVQQANLKALEADLRKNAGETQNVARHAMTDRARLAGLEPRVADAASRTQHVADRLHTFEGQQHSLQKTSVAMANDVSQLAERHALLADLQDDQGTRVARLEERLDGLELVASSGLAETKGQIDVLTSNLDAHARRDDVLSSGLEDAHRDVARLTEQITALERRITELESEEDGQDYRFDALDQRVAVVELEVANAPRLTRTLETRVATLDRAFQEHVTEAPHQEAPSDLAERTLRLEATATKLTDALQHQETGVGALEQRVHALETGTHARDERANQLAAELAAHEKHALPVTIADLRPSPAPPTQDDDLAAIEGIGNVFRARLRENGIRSYEELRAADPDQLGPRIGTRPKTVRAWQSMAEFMQLQGITNQVAELLVRIGINDRHELAQSSPRSIVDRVDAYNAEHEIPLKPSGVDEALARSWIESAQPKLVAN